MRFHRLDLNLLVALDALLTTQNVTRAAERLCLSQSAMSGCLARLRAHFEDELIVPVGRRMVLTPLGSGLVRPLRELLAETEALVTAKPSFDPSRSERSFSIITSDYAAQVLMPKVLQRLAGEAPRVKVTIDVLTEESVENFEHGDTELLLIAEQFAAKTCDRDHIFDDEYVCVAWQGNKGVGRSLSIRQYLSMPHAVVRFPRGRQNTHDQRHLDRLGYQAQRRGHDADVHAAAVFRDRNRSHRDCSRAARAPVRRIPAATRCAVAGQISGPARGAAMAAAPRVRSGVALVPRGRQTRGPGHRAARPQARPRGGLKRRGAGALTLLRRLRLLCLRLCLRRHRRRESARR